MSHAAGGFAIHMSTLIALYIFVLAAFGGWVIIGRVPAILHTPLMSGSNFVHGIVVVGGLYTLLNAAGPVEQTMGFFAVLFGAGNAAGGFVVTERMLAMFHRDQAQAQGHAKPSTAHHAPKHAKKGP